MIADGNGLPEDDPLLAKGFIALVRMGVHDPSDLAMYLGLADAESSEKRWKKVRALIERFDQKPSTTMVNWLLLGIPAGDPFRIRGELKCEGCSGWLEEVPCQYCARQQPANAQAIRRLVDDYRNARKARMRSNGRGESVVSGTELGRLIRAVTFEGLSAIEAGSPDSQEIAHLLKLVLPDVVSRPAFRFGTRE